MGRKLCIGWETVEVQRQPLQRRPRDGRDQSLTIVARDLRKSTAFSRRNPVASREMPPSFSSWARTAAVVRPVRSPNRDSSASISGSLTLSPSR